MTTQMDWMHYAKFSKCAALAQPSFPTSAATHEPCSAPRRYHPDNTGRQPDLSLPKPAKGPEPLCKMTDHDRAKGMWGHQLGHELIGAVVDSSTKVRMHSNLTSGEPRLASPPTRPLSTPPGKDQLGDVQGRCAVERPS